MVMPKTATCARNIELRLPPTRSQQQSPRGSRRPTRGVRSSMRFAHCTSLTARNRACISQYHLWCSPLNITSQWTQPCVLYNNDHHMLLCAQTDEGQRRARKALSIPRARTTTASARLFNSHRRGTHTVCCSPVPLLSATSRPSRLCCCAACRNGALSLVGSASPSTTSVHRSILNPQAKPISESLPVYPSRRDGTPR